MEHAGRSVELVPSADTVPWRCPQSLSELVSLRDWKHPWGAWKSLISSGAKTRKPCVKTKASVELAFVVTVRTRRRIIEQTNDSEAIVSFAKYFRLPHNYWAFAQVIYVLLKQNFLKRKRVSQCDSH